MFNLYLESWLLYNKGVTDFILSTVFKEARGIAVSRLLKSRGSLMKCLGLALLLGFISLGAIGGCNNDGSIVDRFLDVQQTGQTT
ncbi:MAG: hypothetical protein E2O67_04535 [Deltaproteobacteria bacterium]|nr:MAG: hypothetical protein E2O67_04535 [Deltaproteobacteria bacterium]